MGKAASLRRSDFGDGGGLIDNVDVRWESARFAIWDYDGHGPDTPALKVDMIVGDTGEEATQYYSAGKLSDWEPSEDGTRILAVGKATKLNRGANISILLDSLVEAGFPEEEMDADCTVFDGLECHMVRVPAPKRPGLAPKLDDKGNERVSTILVVDKVYGRGEEKSEVKGSESVVEEKGNGVSEKATETVMEILLENQDGMKKKDLAGKIFQVLKKDPNRNEVVQLCYDDVFLGNGPWNYDKKKGIVGG